MKAVYVERVGPPEVLIYGELPEPQPGPNDVLIRVRATSLNRLDVFMREGSHGTSITPPQILGRDIAGEVVQVGSAVQGFQPGDRVVASGSGSYAEYALAPATRTFHLPESCSFDAGGALPTAGLTAYQMLINRARVRPGEDVLVMAAGSGVGSYAVQIAKAVGARVIATAGTDDKLQKAREIGADDVINHYTEDIVALVRALSIMGVGRGSSEDMQALIRLVALGRVQPVIHQRFPLHEAADAHRLLERSDFFGKVVLQV